MDHLFTCSNCQHLNGSECRLHSMKVSAGREVCPQHTFTGPDRAAVQYKLCSECTYFDPAGEQLCLAADQPATQAFPLNCYRYRSMLAEMEGHTVLAPVAKRSAPTQQAEAVLPDAEPERAPQKKPRRSAASRFPFLRYVNPFTLIYLLLLLAIVGVFFHIAPDQQAPQETVLCLLLSLPCMGLLWGLIWGVMNRPVKLLHALTSLLLAADAARLLWGGVAVSQGLLVCGLGAVAVFLVSYGLSRLGTAITNAIFRVRKRAA